MDLNLLVSVGQREMERRGREAGGTGESAEAEGG